jgi:hypothetical protein
LNGFDGAAAARHDALVTAHAEREPTRSGLIVMVSNMISLIDAGGP